MVKNKKKILNKNRGWKLSFDDVCSWLFITYMASGFLRTIFGFVLGKIGIGSLSILVTNMVIYAPFCLLFIYEALAGKIRSGIRKFLLMFLFTALLFAVTLLIYPSYELYYVRPIFGAVDSVFRPDFGAIWGFLLIVLCKDAKQIYKNLYMGAWALTVYCVYQYVNYLSTGYWNVYNYLGELDKQVYSLDFSYSCCLCACIFMVKFSNDHGIKDIAMCILASALMAMGGSRGAIACFAIFIVLFYFREFVILSWKKKTMVILAFAIITLAVYILLPVIISSLSQVNSRSLQAVLTGTFSEDNGRSRIYDIAKNAMKEMPFFGYGSFGDRPFIAPYYYWGYCHNLIYEMILDFGWGIGIAVLVILLLRCISVYLKAREYDLAVISILIGANAKLFVSSSFWSYAYFWMLIAYLFVTVPLKRQKPVKGAGR